MNKTAKTYWVWTELAKQLHPERKAGEPIWEMYRESVPMSWVDRGYVREAETNDK